MTDSEETRSYNEILAENKRLRSRRYQTAGQAAIDVGLYRHAFVAGVIYGKNSILIDSDADIEEAYTIAIAAWKAQQSKTDTLHPDE